MQALRAQSVGELRDVRFVRHRRERKRTRTRRLGRVLTRLTVDAVDPLRFCIVGFQIVIADWPRGRDAAFVLERTKILASEPGQGSAEHLGVATDKIVHPGSKRPSRGILPGFSRLVTAAVEDFSWTPVLGLGWQEAAPLDEQHARSAVA